MKAGDTFLHKSFLDISASNHRAKARMRITAVTKDRVYYTYATSDDNKGQWYLPRDIFEETYGS